MSQAKVFTISPTTSFTDVLAKELINEVKNTPEKLATYLILLPTRRACRSVQEAFLRQSHGKPIMLPRLHPIGDIDGEELFISRSTANIEDIPPAMPTIKRQILLSRIIANLPDFSKNSESDMRLAATLSQLMDQIYTEDLDLADLPSIVDRETFADHWQITIDFLEILSVHWPKILKEQGMIDAADRRNRLINALEQYWQENPPSFPVIAAGSTGSIPATTKLLKTISTLPKGVVILPGLDKTMSKQAWDFVEEGHPQNTLKELLKNIGCTRQNVKIWKENNTLPTSAREEFISHVMSPPDDTHEWQKLHITPTQKTALEKTLKNVQRLDCETPQQEAQLIAILIRETLSDKNKTAALITPNRHLARRVAALCKKWGIEIDDSGGQALNETPIGVYLKLIMQSIIHEVAPISLLALLKHDLCQGAGFKNFRGTVRQMDMGLLRGLPPAKGFDELKKHYQKKINDKTNKHPPHPDVLNLINHLEPLLNPLMQKLNSKPQLFADILKQHLEIAEKMASGNKMETNSLLWQGEAGEAAANFLSDLRIHATQISNCTAHDYLFILDHFMKTISVRPKYGTHPRLMILGQLEARLIKADRVIMAGLNEGSWPPDPGHDPWMSRPMRVDFGLPKPERSITLAAHDFTQGFCGNEVFLTRAIREDGAPTVPARWLARIDTFMQAININPEIIRQSPHMDYIHLLNYVPETKPIDRPAPTPAKAARPDHLSVTKIETWMKDPYAIYAGSVLKLKSLEPLEKEVGAAERGNILHEVMEQFTARYPKNVPDKAKADFIQITRDVLQENEFDEFEWNFWMPRMKRLSDWLIPHEQKWRKQVDFGKSEITGTIKITDGLDKTFTLSGRADRIDHLKAGGMAVIDYKSGGTYSTKKMISGDTPQLPLEALLVNKDGFSESGINEKSTSYIGYWKLTGTAKAGEEIALSDETKLNEAIQTTQKGLTNLIKTYEDETVAYLAIPRLDNAPRFNDFEHLERVKEWAALDENTEDAA